MSPDSPVLVPFEPSPSDPFDRKKAAHLLRRAGFGASPDEITKAVEAGLEATVESLLDVAEADRQDAEFKDTFDAVNGLLTSFGETEGLAAWWVYRMVKTRTPLREKTALFWHGHFATSNEKVENSSLMHRQVETLRRLGWGNVRDLTLALARDPAMIVWLDGGENTKAHPNENFARELMELFTCGIGHYTEADVREAARAFTGWHRENDQFAFKADEHDAGRKRFLGKSGRLDGADIIDILMQHPATPRTLAAKLLAFFATPKATDAVIDEASALLVKTRLDIKWFLRELFLSRWFYSTACYRTRLSSPVEFVVGSVRTLGARWAAPELVGQLQAMGQRLFAPPSVKGWDGERAWFDSSTLAARQEFANALATLEDDNPFQNDLDFSRVVPSDLNDPAKVVDRLAEVVLQGDLPAGAHAELVALLNAPDDDAEGETPAIKAEQAATAFRDDEGVRNGRARRALGLILSLPEMSSY